MLELISPEYIIMHLGFFIIILCLILSIGFLIHCYLKNKKKSELQIQKNIDQLKKSNKFLKVKTKILEQFVMTTTHDLKTPLRSIHGFASRIQLMLEKDDIRKDKLEIYSKFILESIQQLSNIIDDSLEYGRTGKETDIKQIDMKDLLDKIIKRSFMGHQDLTIINNNNIDYIFADHAQIYKVFQNLLENAYKFNDKENKIIEIKSEETEFENIFYVKDNGRGVEEKYYSKIFGLFQRLDGKEIPGTGLGLALVKKIIDHHQGSISVDSEVGKYTQFKFTIPKKI